MTVLPFDEFYDQIDFFTLADSSDTEQMLDVNDSQAPDFHVVMQQVIPLAEKNRREFQANLDNIIGNQSVSANDKVKSTFTLAYTTLAEQKHTDPQHIDEDAVNVGLRQQTFFKVLGEQGDESLTLVMTA